MSATTEGKTKTGPVWLTKDEVCERLNISRNSVDNYVARGDLPKYALAGGPHVRFRLEDVDGLLTPVGHPAADAREQDHGKDDPWDF